MSKISPLVSIGIPVFNGARYLSEAIQSILNQTYSNMEIIICDNASTDDTGRICQDYAANDNRIRYYCNEINLGAGPNYDKCFYHSSGKYFKWAAHDDLIEPTYIEKSVERLELNNKAAMCFSDVKQIDRDGNLVKTMVIDCEGLFSEKQSVRFKAMLNYNFVFPFFFGLQRRYLLEGSQLHGNYMSSDIILKNEIALLGMLEKVCEPLFIHRQHQERYTRSIYPDRQNAAAWYDTRNAGQKSYRIIRLYKEFINIIVKNVPDISERFRCYGFLIKYALKKRNVKLLAFDLIYLISPWVYYNVNFIRESDIKTR